MNHNKKIICYFILFYCTYSSFFESFVSRFSFFYFFSFDSLWVFLLLQCINQLNLVLKTNRKLIKIHQNEWKKCILHKIEWDAQVTRRACWGLCCGNRCCFGWIWIDFRFRFGFGREVVFAFWCCFAGFRRRWWFLLGLRVVGLFLWGVFRSFGKRIGRIRGKSRRGFRSDLIWILISIFGWWIFLGGLGFEEFLVCFVENFQKLYTFFAICERNGSFCSWIQGNFGYFWFFLLDFVGFLGNRRGICRFLWNFRLFFLTLTKK